MCSAREPIGLAAPQFAKRGLPKVKIEPGRQRWTSLSRVVARCLELLRPSHVYYVRIEENIDGYPPFLMPVQTFEECHRAIGGPRSVRIVRPEVGDEMITWHDLIMVQYDDIALKIVLVMIEITSRRIPVVVQLHAYFGEHIWTEHWPVVCRSIGCGLHHGYVVPIIEITVDPSSIACLIIVGKISQSRNRRPEVRIACRDASIGRQRMC